MIAVESDGVAAFSVGSVGVSLVVRLQQQERLAYLKYKYRIASSRMAEPIHIPIIAPIDKGPLFELFVLDDAPT